MHITTPLVLAPGGAAQLRPSASQNSRRLAVGLAAASAGAALVMAQQHHQRPLKASRRELRRWVRRCRRQLHPLCARPLRSPTRPNFPAAAAIPTFHRPRIAACSLIPRRPAPRAQEAARQLAGG